MIHSPSSIGTFVTCPRQYEAKYITKEVVFQPTQHTIYGTRVHAALEVSIKGGSPLPQEFEHFQPIVDATLAMTGELHAETQYAMDATGKKVAYKDKSAMVRCIVDLVRKLGATAWVIDWKTGKEKEDNRQLRINAACIFANFPDIERVKVGFAYTKSQALQTYAYDRKDFADLVAQISHEIQGIETAEHNQSFKPKPSGLCRNHCDVVACKHNGRR